MFQAAWSLALIQERDAPRLRALKAKGGEGTSASLQTQPPSLSLQPTAFLEDTEALPKRQASLPGAQVLPWKVEAVRRERWDGWRLLPHLDSPGHLCFRPPEAGA